MTFAKQPGGSKRGRRLRGPNRWCRSLACWSFLAAPAILAWRKLLPAVYNLNVDGVLPSHFAVVAFGLPAEGATQADPDEYIRKRAREGIDGSPASPG